MGNRFSRDPGPSPFMGQITQIAGLLENKRQFDVSEEGRREDAGKALAAEKGIATKKVAIEQRAANTKEREIALKEQVSGGVKRIHKPASNVDLVTARAGLSRILKQQGVAGMDQAFTPFFNKMESLAEEGFSKLQSFEYLKANKATSLMGIVESYKKKIKKAGDEGDDVYQKALIGSMSVFDGSLNEEGKDIFDLAFPLSSRHVEEVRESREADLAKINRTGRGAQTGDDKKSKRLTTLARRYNSLSTRGTRAELGTDQYIENPRRDEIASKLKEQAGVILEQYVAAGGDAKDLGVNGKPFGSKEGVAKAVRDGSISEAQGVKILKTYYGLK